MNNIYISSGGGKPPYGLISAEFQSGVCTCTGGKTERVEGNIVSFEAETEVPVKSLAADIEPVQAGTGDPSPDNVRPISGHTGTMVTRTGKNLFDYKYYVAKPSASNVEITGENVRFYTTNTAQWASLVYPNMMAHAGTTYTGSIDVSAYTAGVCWFALGRASDNIIVAQVLINGPGHYTFTYTPVAEIEVHPAIIITDTTILSGDITFSNAQIEIGSTATAYEPYQADTYDISFPAEAGTIYGGKLDVTTGLLTVDKAMVDLGTLNWTYSTAGGSQTFRGKNIQSIIKRPVSQQVAAIGVCSNYPVLPARTVFENNLGLGVNTGDGFVWIHDPAYTDVDSFSTAMAGVQFVYELATPLVYQLSPIEVSTLLGVNNIYSSTGDVTVEYYTQVQTANSSPAMFSVQQPGTYYLTASDGDKSASAQVEITKESQLEKVELTYELVLWEAGNNNTEITGDWTGVANGCAYHGIYISDEQFKIACGNSVMVSKVTVATKSKIDFTKYSTLKVKTNADCVMAGLNNLSVSNSNSTAYNTIASTALAKDSVCSLDISAIDSAYIHLGMDNQSLSTKYINVDKIWLE